MRKDTRSKDLLKFNEISWLRNHGYTIIAVIIPYKGYYFLLSLPCKKGIIKYKSWLYNYCANLLFFICKEKILIRNNNSNHDCAKKDTRNNYCAFNFASQS